MDLLLVLSFILLFSGLASHWWTRRAGSGPLSPNAPPSSPRAGTAPRVSIVVPARNEEDTIERCLQSLAGLDYPDYEVLVVDASEDRTRALAQRVARDPPERIRVLEEPPLAPGWVGKSWACWNARKEATGAYLLFTDADTWHAPHSLSRAMDEARHHDVGLLTGLTRQELPTWWERLLMPPIFLLIATAVGGLTDRTLADPKLAIANGQYLLMRATDYDRIGGHAAIRHRIAEDLALARLAAREGVRARFVNLAALVSVHMYRTPRALWRGWRKNLSEGFVLTSPLPMILAVLTAQQGAWAVPLAVTALALGRWEAALVAGAAYLLFAARLAWTQREAGRVPAAYALLHPVGVWFFAVTMAASLIDRWSGRGHVWKGRRYASARD